MKLARTAGWVGAGVLIILGVARLRFDVEILNLLPAKLPVAQGLKLYQQHFAGAGELIITVEAPTPEEAETAARALAEELRSRTALVAGASWQPPWLDHPAESTELMAYLWFNQPPAVLGELTNRLAAPRLTNVLAEARERLATSLSPTELGLRGYDPYGLMELPESVSQAAPSLGADELFVAPDRKFRLVFVQARPDLSSYKACRAWLTEVRRIVAEAHRTGRIPSILRFTGRPAFVTEIAGGIEGDTLGSAGGTLLTIGILFWLTHRRVRPLVILLALLLFVLAATTALGGLVYGTVNVVSMGFASILLGLAEDFGIVIYQESRCHPELAPARLRHTVAPGIFWSALTTAGAFATLNLSSLPGLGQLGSFVALGILTSAVVMLYLYLPWLFRVRRAEPESAALLIRTDRSDDPTSLRRPLASTVLVAVSVLLVLVAGALLGWGGIRFDRSPNPLKPKRSEANAALEGIKAHFGRERQPLWVLIPGRDEAMVAERLALTRTLLDKAVAQGLVAGVTLPTTLWPQPMHQQANRPILENLLRQRPLLEAAALDAGFTSNALAATEAMFDSWQRAAQSAQVFWPSNEASRWVLNKMAARSNDGWMALGLIHLTTNNAATKEFTQAWPSELERAGVILSGWELLGSSVFDTVVRELPRVVIPIAVLVLFSLWLAYRNLREVFLSVLTLAMSGLCLGGAMNLLKWDWNILNLMALPLLLGMGVDYSIHMQLALRRYRGDVRAAHRSVGRALLLAGATTIAGFASLGFSTNAGMASLGQVCALGITLALMISVYLLPVWWKMSRAAVVQEESIRTGIAPGESRSGNRS